METSIGRKALISVGLLMHMDDNRLTTIDCDVWIAGVWGGYGLGETLD